MIDRKEIARHLIVQKKNEITVVSEANDSNIVDEEVIYNALGYSIFENLKEINLVFEGWRDKRLFLYALEKCPSQHSDVKKAFADIGCCHVKGVKDVLRVTPLLELANRKCFILSDADSVAKEHQKAYEGYGDWIRYDELFSASPIVTVEDFISSNAFESPIKLIVEEHPSLTPLPITELPENGGKLQRISSWLKVAGMNSEDIRVCLDQIKSGIFENLKPSHIRPSYYEYLKNLAERTSQKCK